MGDGPALGYYFKVTIDRWDLGVFTKVDGLGAKYETMTIKEGGLNSHVHTLAGRMTYDNLKITRPVDAASGDLAAWFTDYQKVIQAGRRLERRNAAITAFNGDDDEVATWALMGVLPVRYAGPSFQAGGSSVLTESVEFAHNGFWSQGV